MSPSKIDLHRVFGFVQVRLAHVNLQQVLGAVAADDRLAHRGAVTAGWRPRRETSYPPRGNV